MEWILTREVVIAIALTGAAASLGGEHPAGARHGQRGACAAAKHRGLRR